MLIVCFRIQLFTAGITDPNDTGRFVKSIYNSRFGKVFAISYDPTGIFYFNNHHKTTPVRTSIAQDNS